MAALTLKGFYDLNRKKIHIRVINQKGKGIISHKRLVTI